MGLVLRSLQRADYEKIKLNETHHGSFLKAIASRTYWTRTELQQWSGAKE